MILIDIMKTLITMTIWAAFILTLKEMTQESGS